MDVGRRFSSAWSGSMAFVRSDDVPPAPAVDPRRAAIVALIPLVTFLGFAAIRVASQPKLNFDEHIFLDVGRHILDTGLPLRAYAQPRGAGLFFDHTPLYPYFVALLTAVGGPTALIVRSSTLLFGLLTILLVFRIGLELRGLGSAFVGAMLLAVNPFFVMFSWFVRMEVPMCFFLVVAVYLMIHERLFLAGLAIAAAVMLKGMTAQYLIRRTYPVKAGETVLFHAAAGGVGLIACQWLKALGATVIGTLGSEEKAAIARAHGCDHVIISTREDIPARVREITGGAGVPVVYDSVGKDTFLASLDCLKPLGLMVSFGNASGKVTPFDIGILSQKGSPSTKDPAA